VDGDDAEIAARGVMGEQHLFVAKGLHGREDIAAGTVSGERGAVSGTSRLGS
jgi:hypothetical protein